MTGLILAFLLPANAASLDLLELGGAYGSPGATDSTATWWNPAGLAAGSGTRFHIEGAPTFAKVDISRTNPNYSYTPGTYGPESVDYGGNAAYSRTTVIPFLGIASDLGQPGLGVGFSISVPQGRGASGSPDQVTRHHLVGGGNQAVYAMVSGAYEVKERFSFGFTGAFVSSEYQSDLYTETATALNDGLQDRLDQDFYSDTILEDERYSARAVSDPLRDTAITFGLGARLQASDKVSVNLAYRHGFRVDHTGTGTLAFNCPSTDDFWGRGGANTNGICDSVLDVRQSVGYNLPSRVHGSVVFNPVETVRLEAMGGYVGWSVFSDYDIEIVVDPDSVPLDDEGQRIESASIISQTKQWARDNRNSYWLALDGKVKATDKVEIGGRVLFDKAAVPTNVLSPNNYDADTLALTAVVLGQVHKNLSLGLSAGQYFSARRTVTNSAWGLAIDPAERNDIRYFYPEMNGSFGSTLTRLGLILRGQFGADNDE